MMGIPDRILLALYAMVLTAVSLALFVVSLGWTTPLESLLSVLEDPRGRMALGLSSLAFLAVSLRFLYFGFRRKYPSRAIIHETPLGEIRVSLGAVENLVKKVARQIHGVRDVRASVANTPEGVVTDIRAWVSPDVSVPEVSENIQKSVGEYVKNVVGVGVAEVRVLVENITTEARRARVE